MLVSASRSVDLTEIPVVDFGPFGSADRQGGILRQIEAACRSVGFFYIAHHGVPAAATSDILLQCRRFFALPQPARDAIRLTRSPLYRGYLPPGVRGERDRPTDILESFNVGRELGPDAAEVKAGLPLHGGNQWPDGLPGFRNAVLAYYAAMNDLMHRLLEALSLVVGQERGWLGERFGRPLTQMRLLHYWPQPFDVANMIGARPHQDTSFITILLQDDAGGLEVQRPDGEWLAAPPRPDMFVVNVGELLQHITAGSFAAAMHRVVNRSGVDRYSVPFFCTPDYDAVLTKLPAFAPAASEAFPAPLHVGDKMLRFYRGLWPSAGA